MSKKLNQNKTRDSVRNFVIQWNKKYPFDFIWRKKYGVAFGSEEHRHMSFIDMLFDLEEEKLMSNIKKEEIEIKNKNINPEDEISDAEFDEVNINDY